MFTRFKLSQVIFFFFFYFFIQNRVNAYSFIKYSNNPVLKPDQSYDIQGVYSSSTILLDSKFYMYYSGSDGQKTTINVASSSDGVNWVKNVKNPIIKINSTNSFICEKGVHDPDVIYDENDSLFKMWFVANCEPQSTGVPRYWIKYAESTNGIDWTITDKPVIYPVNQWEIEGVTWPTVLKKNNQFQMWYAGRNSSGLWQIGHATSNDGKNWQKDTQPIISPNKSWESGGIGGPDAVFDNNQYTLFYHQNILHADSNDGLVWIKPNDNPLLSKQGNETLLWSPDQLNTLNNKLIYYSLLINNKWQIALASEQPIVLPTPKPKLMIIPGFFGSWNKEALLHNQIVGVNDWILNPIVKEYSGVTNSLDNLGYQKNSDYYLFAYDWRQPIANSANALNTFITQKIPDTNTKVSILAHSEGGLVGRAYMQQFGDNRVNRLVTVGTPHSGVALAYNGVEAGKVDNENVLDFMAKKILLQVNKQNLFHTDRQNLNSLVPVMKDFLPTYDFLKNINNQLIPLSSMQIKNDFLLNLQNSFSSLFAKLATFFGEKTDTVWGYKVGPRTSIDKLYDVYPDGHPTSKITELGDETIVSTSAKAGNDTTVLPNKDHHEIVLDASALRQIFSKLDIPYQDNQIVSGSPTKVFPGLLFLIQSPGAMQVSYGNDTIDEKDGQIFVENAPSGTYTLKVKGAAVGNYTVHIGQFVQDKVMWDRIDGSIANPTNETDTYTIIFNNQDPKPFIVNQNDPLFLFDELISYLTDINKSLSNSSVKASIASLQNAKKQFIAKNKGKLLLELQNTHAHLITSLQNEKLESKNKIVYAIDTFENVYDISLAPFEFTQSTQLNASTFESFRKAVDIQYDRLLGLKNKRKDTAIPSLYLQIIEEKLLLGTRAINANNSRLVTIITQTIGQLLLLVNNFK